MLEKHKFFIGTWVGPAKKIGPGNLTTYKVQVPLTYQKYIHTYIHIYIHTYNIHTYIPTYIHTNFWILIGTSFFVALVGLGFFIIV